VHTDKYAKNSFLGEIDLFKHGESALRLEFIIWGNYKPLFVFGIYVILFYILRVHYMHTIFPLKIL
jgi:hypothetical protein